MVRRRRRYRSVTIFRLFLIAMTGVVILFGYRLVSGKLKTSFDTAQTMHLAEDIYTMGRIYDRSGEEISPDASSFAEILGADINKTKGDKKYLCSNAPWLYGTENELTLKTLGKTLKSHSNKRTGGDVKTTFDQKLQEHLEETAKAKGYKRQYIVVSNYKTGEILGMYSNANAGSSLSDVLYSPGSTIKPLFLAAALTASPELKDYTYDCVDDNYQNIAIHCAGHHRHGLCDYKRGTALSCNKYFLGMLDQMDKTEKQKMLKTLRKIGFDNSHTFSQLRFADPTFTGGDDSERQLYFSVLGQGNCKISPFFLNAATGMLFNGGTMTEPHWILQKRVNGQWEEVTTEKKEYKMCSKEVAGQVVEAMTEVTAYGTGRSAAMPEYGMAGKTGTAEIEDKYHVLSGTNTVWWTGGLTSEDTPYAITVCLDDVMPQEADSGTAAAYAKEIMEYVVSTR